MPKVGSHPCARLESVDTEAHDLCRILVDEMGRDPKKIARRGVPFVQCSADRCEAKIQTGTKNDTIEPVEVYEEALGLIRDEAVQSALDPQKASKKFTTLTGATTFQIPPWFPRDDQTKEIMDGVNAIKKGVADKKLAEGTKEYNKEIFDAHVAWLTSKDGAGIRPVQVSSREMSLAEFLDQPKCERSSEMSLDEFLNQTKCGRNGDCSELQRLAYFDFLLAGLPVVFQFSAADRYDPKIKRHLTVGVSTDPGESKEYTTVDLYHAHAEGPIIKGGHPKQARLPASGALSVYYMNRAASAMDDPKLKSPARRGPEIKADLQRAMRYDPHNASAYYNYAHYLIVWEQDLIGAYKQAKKAYGLYPADHDIMTLYTNLKKRMKILAPAKI